MLLSNTPDQAESLLYSPDKAEGSIGLYVNVNKTEFMYLNKKESSLKLVGQFAYLSTKNGGIRMQDINNQNVVSNM